MNGATRLDNNELNKEKLEELRAEIIRLGLNSNPSRLEYTKRRDPKHSPSATGVMRSTGLNWKEVLEQIGLTPKKTIKQNNWKKYSDLDFKLLVLDIIYNNHIVSRQDYIARKEEAWPSETKVLERFGSWKKVNELLLIKYPDAEFHVRGYSAQKDGDAVMIDKNRLKKAIDFIESNKITSWTEYSRVRTKDVPTINELRNGQRIKYSELTTLIKSSVSFKFGR